MSSAKPQASSILVLAQPPPFAILEVTGAFMIDDTLNKIEAKVQASDSIKEDRKHELLELIRKLKSEVAGLSRTHGEEAESIARFTEVSTHEATRTNQNPEL